MTIKLELTEERTQRELSEEEWAFPIWRWAAFSLFDTLILVSPLTRELIYPGGSDSRFYLGKSLGNLMLVPFFLRPERISRLLFYFYII